VVRQTDGPPDIKTDSGMDRQIDGWLDNMLSVIILSVVVPYFYAASLAEKYNIHQMFIVHILAAKTVVQ
jgi:hypothetical protein